MGGVSLENDLLAAAAGVVAADDGVGEAVAAGTDTVGLVVVVATVAPEDCI